MLAGPQYSGGREMNIENWRPEGWTSPYLVHQTGKAFRNPEFLTRQGLLVGAFEFGASDMLKALASDPTIMKEVEGKKQCPFCQGKGKTWLTGSTCYECNGQGQVKDNQYIPLSQYLKEQK